MGIVRGQIVEYMFAQSVSSGIVGGEGCMEQRRGVVCGRRSVRVWY